MSIVLKILKIHLPALLFIKLYHPPISLQKIPPTDMANVKLQANEKTCYDEAKFIITPKS